MWLQVFAWVSGLWASEIQHRVYCGRGVKRVHRYLLPSYSTLQDGSSRLEKAITLETNMFHSFSCECFTVKNRLVYSCDRMFLIKWNGWNGSVCVCVSNLVNLADVPTYNLWPDKIVKCVKLVLWCVYVECIVLISAVWWTAKMAFIIMNRIWTESRLY